MLHMVSLFIWMRGLDPESRTEEADRCGGAVVIKKNAQGTVDAQSIL